MAHSYVDFRGNTVHLHDEDIFWVMSLLKEAWQSAGSPECLRELFCWWDTDEAKPGVGCIDVRFDEFINEAGRIDLLLRFLDVVEHRIRSYGPIVPADMLNGAVQSAVIIFLDQKTEMLLPVISKFRELFKSSDSSTTTSLPVAE